MNLTCFHCGRQIKGRVIQTNPSRLAPSLGADYAKAFHPACYAKAESEAARELRGEKQC